MITHKEIMETWEIAINGGTWDFDSALGDTMKEKYEKFYCFLNGVTALLQKHGAKGYFWILTSPEIMSMIETCTAGFNFSHPHHHMPLGVEEVTEIGILAYRWKLFVDTNLENNMGLVGASAASELSIDNKSIVGKFIIKNFVP